jgi:formylglycine-generating enzyme
MRFQAIVSASCFLLFQTAMMTCGQTPKTFVVPDDMVLVEGGEFDMGDIFVHSLYPNPPVHKEKVASFLMGKHEVTFEEYDVFCAAMGSKGTSDNGWGRGRRPVIDVDWLAAACYCNWRSKKEGLRPCYETENYTWECDLSADGYRLPAEAEWEYAARERGRKVLFGNGRSMADPREINFDGSESRRTDYSVEGESRKKTVEVGSFKPNSLGLYDMSGNVWEWCNDIYSAKDLWRNETRVLRGGSWTDSSTSLQVYSRSGSQKDGRYTIVGFRLARNVPK